LPAGGFGSDDEGFVTPARQVLGHPERCMGDAIDVRGERLCDISDSHAYRLAGLSARDGRHAVTLKKTMSDISA
jgi:hypothetical protein